MPFLPVNIFKRMQLSSVPESEIVRTLTSSATSSQIPSRIPLDQTTRNRQMRALAAILAYRLGAHGGHSSFWTPRRTPPPAAIASFPPAWRRMRGYLMAATKKEYVLKQDSGGLTLDVEKLLAVTDAWKAAGEPFCLLGYTYILYQHVVRPLEARGVRLELPASTFVLHFGGWKRLRQQAVDKSVLNARAAAVFGLPQTRTLRHLRVHRTVGGRLSGRRRTG